MLSRRKFLISGLGSMAIVMELIDSPQAFARKKKTEVISGPHSLSRNSWAPAISPDFAGMIKKGYLCLADRYGRLSIVDLKKAGDPRHPPKVVAELTNLGKNVVSVSFDQIQAYVLISEEKDNLKKNSLTTINLTKPEEPHIVSTVPLTQLKEVRALSGDRKMSIVAGTSCSDQEVVLVLNGSSKASITEASLISTITTKLPVVAMLYQGRQLTILSTDGTDSRVDFIDLANKSAPRLIESIEQKGNFSQLSQNKNLIVIAGVTSEGNCEARSLSLKPAPHAIAGVKLDQLQFVLASAVQKDKYLLLGKSQDKLTLLSVSIDKHGNLIRSQEIDLGKNKAANFQTAQLVWDKKQLYVAAGWSGVKVLKSNRDSFSDQFTYAIPRLAASGIATWGKHAIVVGGELVRYDISEPQDPKIESRQALTSPIKSMVGAGSFLLCLTKGNLLLKKMSLLDQDLATIKVVGNNVAFDKSQHRAYVVKQLEKVTRVYPFKVFSDSLDSQKYFDVPGSFKRVSVLAGQILLYDLPGMALVTVFEKVEKTGERKFGNLAIRDAILEEDYILATAVDKESKGFLLVLSRNDKDLNLIGTLDLPHNGTALSATGKTVAAIGKDQSGKDMVTIIDVSSPSTPRLITTLNVLEAASAVTIASHIALVAGRGLELVDLG